MMPLIRVQSKLYGSFIIRTTYSLSVLVNYSYCHLISQTRNPYSIVLIILHGSIQGSSPEFFFAKIPVNTTIKDSKFIVLS
jgi:hypothetical protein